jgi:hypothetical protein
VVPGPRRRLRHSATRCPALSAGMRMPGVSLFRTSNSKSRQKRRMIRAHRAVSLHGTRRKQVWRSSYSRISRANWSETRIRVAVYDVRLRPSSRFG